MNKLVDLNYVKALQGNLRTSLETPQGKEVMKFLETICGWYDFHERERDQILINHGKRQVLATIKTLMELTPEQVVAMAKEEA